MSKAEIFYEPHRKHPALFQDQFLEAWVHPDLLEIKKDFEKYQQEHGTEILSTDSPLDATTVSKISSKLNIESNEVYSFGCLSDHFLEIMNDELKNFYELSEKHSIDVRRPNSMNNYGVILNEIGMRPMITALQQQYIYPLARVLFPKEGEKFDDHHSFIVRYQADEDLGLDMHTDDSDVTFNVCLGDKNFTGATLVFCGMFGTPDHRQFTHTYHHKMGRAILHLGNRRHGADDIASGTRVNWIVWNHNWKHRGSEEYRNSRTFGAYPKESGPPSKVCLSYTHDKDYLDFNEKLPKAAENIDLHPWCPPPGKEYEGYGMGQDIDKEAAGERHPNEL